MREVPSQAGSVSDPLTRSSTNRHLTVTVFDAAGPREPYGWLEPFRVALAKRQGIDDANISIHVRANGPGFLTEVLDPRHCPDVRIILFADPQQVEWHDDEGPHVVTPVDSTKEARAKARRLPRTQRRIALSRIDRARHFYDFATDATLAMEAIRRLLLVQETLLAEGLVGIAASEDFDHVDCPESRSNPTLARMLELIDPNFHTPVAPPAPGATAKEHETFAAELVALLDGERTTRHAERVRDRVQAFYAKLPFNLHGQFSATKAAVESNPIRSQYPDLHELLVSGSVRTWIEFGCGVGWLSCAAALHYDLDVLAVDFTERALERGREVAEALQIDSRVRFVQSDIFEFETPQRFDIAVSIGVLHHTHDARGAFAHVQRFATHHAYLGLYHGPGRRPFLAHFRRLARESGLPAALAAYRGLDGVRAGDDQHIESWFRDQVLHPHESQHTVAEINRWFDDAGFKLRSTSINGFQPVDESTDLAPFEAEAAERSLRAIHDERRYYPGFFTALGSRGTAAGARR